MTGDCASKIKTGFSILAAFLVKKLIKRIEQQKQGGMKSHMDG